MLRQLRNSLRVFARGKRVSLPVSSHCASGMNFFDGRHYKINKYFLSSMGQWPYQTSRKKYISLVIIFLLYGTQMTAKLIATLSSYNMDVIMEDFAPIMADIAATIKLLNSTLQMKKMKEMLIRIEADYATFTLKEELKIMHDYAENGRTFSIMCAGVFFVSMMLFMIPPLKHILFNNGTNDRVFLHHTEYFVDPLDYYYPIILHSYITIFIVVYAVVAMDTILVVIVQHVCGLFTTIGYRLCLIANDDEDLDLNPSKREDQSFKSISICVRRHQRAIEFAKLTESYYSTSFFVELGFILITLSVTACQALSATNSNNFFQHCSIFYSAVALMLFECVNGQRLIDHSSRVHEYLIDTKWYETSLRTRRILNFMVLRAQYPCALTAANIFDISMETFGAVLRTAMSYFTVLRSTQ